MASLAAITTGGGGLVSTADSTGNLDLKSGTTTIVALTSTGASVTGDLSATGITTVAAGTAALPAVVSATGTADTGLWFPAADTVAASTAGTERMRIDSSGNVGIGQVSPNARLQVDSSSATYSANFRTRNSNFGNGVVGAANGILTVATDMNNIAFYTGSNLGVDGTSIPTNERLRIDSSGNVLVGTTAQSGSEAFGITRAANAATYIYMLKSGQVECTWGFKSSTDTNMYIGTGSTAVGTYGLYQANLSSSWSAVSDERFKIELQPIENALDKITNVRAVTGRYTYDEENGRTARRSFLIAQDFLSALPEAVDQQDADKLGLSYTDTIPLLVAAIKELKTIIDTQAAQIAALNAKVGI